MLEMELSNTPDSFSIQEEAGYAPEFPCHLRNVRKTNPAKIADAHSGVRHFRDGLAFLRISLYIESTFLL